ncbi:MAG: hypothetical protein WAM39_13615 [Bryobacteraceae bacterium]
MNLSFLAQTYAIACPDLSPEQVAEVISSALDRAREKHADFDRFLPAVEFLSTKVFTDHKSIPLDAYIETLYAAVKHSDFARDWRKEIARQRQMQEPLSAHIN